MNHCKYNILYAAILISGTFMLNAYASINGRIEQNDTLYGRYFSKDNSFSVNIPPIMAVKIFEYQDTNFTSVVFTSDTFWMMNGQYTVDHIKMPTTVNAIKTKALVPTMKTIINTEKKAELTIKGCKFINIHHTKAYQCIGTATIDNLPAMYVGTSLLIKGRIMNAYGLESLKNSQFHWDRYNQMINSIE